MPIVDTVLNSARTHLNDDNAINWPDPNLLPKFQEAYRDLVLELSLSGIQVLQEVTADFTINTGVTDVTLAAGYPTDIISPIWMKEKLVGETDDFLISMTPIDFIPNVAQDTRLNWWSWRQNKLWVLGALNATVVQLRYRGTLAIPTLASDNVGINLGDSYLSYRTAALAFASTKDYKARDEMNATAQLNLRKIMKYYVTYEKQILPTRRIPYHRRYNNTVRNL